VTENQLILSLCREKELGIETSNDERIQRFRETYKDQAGLITRAAQGDAKALRRLRWICGLKVISKTNPWAGGPL
jgi:hypothetical protein